jgi:ABC-type branched-subunit amino acid transport system permease subunit
MGYLLTQLARLFETSIRAVGSHLSIAISNIFFLGVPVMYSAGAYTMVILQKNNDLNLFFSIILSLLVVFFLSLIFVLTYLKLKGESFTVFTLTSILAFDAMLKSWDGLTGGVLGISGIMRPESITSLKELVILQFIIMILILVGEYVLLKTWFGRALLGIKENTCIVESFGISAKKIGSIVIIISSFLAALSGIIAIWRIRFLDPSFGGVLILVEVLTIAIVAAKPKVRWLALSTLFVVLLPEVLRFLSIPSIYVGHLRNLMYAGMLIIILKTISKNILPRKRFI